MDTWLLVDNVQMISPDAPLLPENRNDCVPSVNAMVCAIAEGIPSSNDSVRVPVAEKTQLEARDS
ncbi:hypothetical protein AGMMS49992_31080 [Clostridia bacterium]|nr:hypothetical protein AGMMS49992_31080 [Clostridia bacterium]